MHRAPQLLAFALVAVSLWGIGSANPAFAAGGPVVYATSDETWQESALYSIDPDTGGATKIGKTGYYAVGAIDFDGEGKLYGVGEDSSGYSVLIEIDLGTGRGTLVGKTGISNGSRANDAAYDEVNDVFYLYVGDNRLYTVDLDTGRATYVGYYGWGDPGGDHAIGFDGSGTLYDLRQESLWTVNPSNNDHTVVSYGLKPNTDDPDEDSYLHAEAVDWWDASGVFYAIAYFWDDSEREYGYRFARIDPDRKEVTPIGTMIRLYGLAVTEKPANRAPVITSGVGYTYGVSLSSGSPSLDVSAYDPDGDPLTYWWSFGDGSHGSGSHVTHHYTEAGVYHATVTVSDGRLEASGTVRIEVNHPPRFSSFPSVTPDLAELGSPVEFHVSATDEDSSYLQYRWTFGDGGTGTGSSATHAYHRAGEYTARVEVTDHMDTVSATRTVRVAPTFRVTKLKAKLDFKRSGRDKFSIRGEVDLPSDFDPWGVRLRVNVGGFAVYADLGKNGKVKGRLGSASLKRRHGQWTFKLKYKHANLSSAWEDEGVRSLTTHGTGVSLRTMVEVGSTAFILTRGYTYRAKSGRWGKIK